MQWVASICPTSMTNRIHDRAVTLLEASRGVPAGSACDTPGVAEEKGRNCASPDNSLEEEQMELLDAIAASMGETGGPQASGTPAEIRQAAITALLEQLCAASRAERGPASQADDFSSWMRNSRLAPSLRT